MYNFCNCILKENDIVEFTSYVRNKGTYLKMNEKKIIIVPNKINKNDEKLTIVQNDKIRSNIIP